MYKKRAGTSGIRGQLYETKLISLLLFRARHNNTFEEFHLASNVDGIGAFDDICIRAKLKGSDRPVALFIQAKHREGDNVLTLNNKNDWDKYFDSYLKIRRAFKPNNSDVIFNGTFDDTECFFVLYTNGKGDINHVAAESTLINNIDALLSTDDETASQLPYSNENIDLKCQLALEEQVISLAARVAQLYYGEVNYKKILDDELVSRYHVILAQKVIDVSDVQPGGYREATVKKKIFDSNEEFVNSFKEALSIEVLKRRTVTDEEIQYLLQSEDCYKLIYRLIGNVIMYNNNNGMLEFIDKKTPENLKKQLSKVYVSKSDVDEMIHRAAKKILGSETDTFHSFKVPTSFGNKDLRIRGNDVKIEKRLNHLTSVFHSLLDKPHPNDIVTIDESLGKGFLQLNGGIAGAVGNILVLDENTELMKFTDDCDSLGGIAKTFLEKLKEKIPNLLKYRFEIKVKNFPKLSHNCSEYEKCLAKDFLHKLLFYTDQADESRVEDILMEEIEELQCSKGDNRRVTSYAIFLAYHDYIQKWWKSPDKGTYLTKQDAIFDITISKVVKELLMTSLNTIYRNKVKNIDYTFKEDALSSLKLQDPLSSTIVVTESSALTVAKVVQYCKKRDHIVLEFEYILNLPMDDCTALCAELKDTDINKILIFVCDNIPNSRNLYKTFKNIVKAIEHKIKIIITNQIILPTVLKHFGKVFYLVNDLTSNLTDLSEKSQMDILNNATVIFQGKQAALNFIIDEESMSFVGGDVLNKIICQEPLVIGQSLTNSNYEEMKYLYVDRYVTRHDSDYNDYDSDDNSYDNYYNYYDNNYVDDENEDSSDDDDEMAKKFRDNAKRVRPKRLVKTITDMQDDVILVTALPGMGKSTLLTYLSLKTQEDEQRVWIVRINLVDYSREFNMWQHHKTVIDTLQTLNFMCQVILGEEKLKTNTPAFSLKESNSNEVELNNYVGDQMTEFELKIFLHFYNKGRIIFLFDGFDEICPHYANEVMQLMKTVRSYPKKHKMWITSRSYNEITAILQQEFKILYKLDLFLLDQMNTYLKKFWDSNLILQDFNKRQMNNVHKFIKYMRDIRVSRTVTVSKMLNIPLSVICFNFLNYLKNKIRLSSIPLWEEIKWELKDEPGVCFANKNTRFIGDTSSMYKFLGTPLHLYVVADYFLNEIKDVSKQCQQWNSDINTLIIYERFLERKLRNIRFQEKNKIDIYRPDNINTYEKEQSEFITKHKRLAAYAVFHIISDKLYSTEDLTDVENLIEVIKQGGEKTGLIYCVTSDNIPIFVHKTFAEYFAVTYICDLLKNAKCNEKQQSLIRIILKEIFFESSANVRSILDSKLLLDDALMGVLKSNGIFIFNLLSEEARQKKIKEFKTRYPPLYSFRRALLENLYNFLSLFLSILETHVNEDNVDDFIDIIRESHVFGCIDAKKYKPFIIFALDNVRRLKPSRFNSMFPIFLFDIVPNFMALSNDDIFEIIIENHRKLWLLLPNLTLNDIEICLGSSVLYVHFSQRQSQIIYRSPRVVDTSCKVLKMVPNSEGF